MLVAVVAQSCYCYHDNFAQGVSEMTLIERLWDGEGMGRDVRDRYARYRKYLESGDRDVPLGDTTIDDDKEVQHARANGHGHGHDDDGSK